MLTFWIVVLILCTICDGFVGVDQFNIGTAFFFLFKIVVGGILLYFTITPMAYLAFRTRGIIVSMIVAAVIALVMSFYQILLLQVFSRGQQHILFLMGEQEK